MTANANVPILYLTKDSKQFALTLPAMAKNGELKALQYANLSNNLSIAKKLLFDKFTTHKASLEHFDITISIDETLTHLALAQSIEEVMGIEGAFAKRYFAHYFSLFEKSLTKGFRSKNPPLDPINAMLSYIYTLSYYAITAKLYMRGFDPSLSYLHTPLRSHFALSSDLLEPLRASINCFVAELFLKQILHAEDFTCKNGVYLKYDTRRQLWTHLKPFMNSLNPQINRQIVMLKKNLEKNDALL
ncbi:CRISPR-associated endonuclease Cas1 [Sulfurospirillum diekertiae]|uniref:CRISPR-associated endonuclease Cas1 n=1 Tax=Sulfurospirillum diekertiae TaxID=1854492 RepID=A0A858KAW4_9BACT|nr:CRISPR-associated endonuclease Cas1 [Sulfurospirillum diekertiae]QIR77891.2 CRISPR-associated endonuclease Cas1 [Sulfurospirillum diekertiae]